ncbi:alpha/beta hydrolase [Pantanalinema sp. GBBB05]|uniref:alpha/beta hydrolase n=1 Tax=Pantanalinema sp. GBBB05 TaxID=2604139 RepID=UPI001D465A8C|nr:alpha/beta fold hydrolase [Pantanalinema sp. GBBB05]
MIGFIWRLLVSSILLALVITSPVQAADRITFWFGSAQRSLSLNSLELYATQVYVTPELEFYLNQLTKAQQQQLQTLLQQRLEVSPIAISQVTYSAIGEALLQQAGNVIQTDTRQNGFQALRAALLLAASDPDGLTAINTLRQFPGQSIHVDLDQAFNLATTLDQSKTQSKAIAAIQKTAAREANQTRINFAQQPDLRQPGDSAWQRQTQTIYDASRDRSVTFDLYLPPTQFTELSQPLPVLFLLHGAAEDRQTFTYLAQHLASHGFAIVVPENSGNSSQRFRQFLQGQAEQPDVLELINQPLDVTFLLNQFQQQAKTEPGLQGLNWQQVGVIGHSQGGYAALTLAGAPIEVDRLRQTCQQPKNVGISQVIQCQLLQLPAFRSNLHDPRVQAVIAVNPAISQLLGQSGLSQIQVPVMMVSGSADLIAPTISEQIDPFTWLTTPEKYLALIENGTHFSVLAAGSLERIGLPIPADLIGSEPTIAQSYLKALSTAFFQTYLAHNSEAKSYLNAAYGRYLSQPQLKLSIVRSIPHL